MQIYRKIVNASPNQVWVNFSENTKWLQAHHSTLCFLPPIAKLIRYGKRKR